MSEPYGMFSPPPARPAEPDLWAEAGNEPADEGGELDPGEAAALLAQTARETRGEFDLWPPLFLVLAALVFLLAYGAVWWSVRGQHPYDGPAGWSLGAIYGAVVVWAVTASARFRRATRGIGGRTRRQQQAEGVAFVVILTAIYVFQGALHHAGASKAVVYGIYPAVAPLIVLGCAMAANAAARVDWRWLGPLLVLIVVASGGAFAGPATAWLVGGSALAAALLSGAAIEVWQRRA